MIFKSWLRVWLCLWYWFFQCYSSSLIILYNIKIFVLLKSSFGWGLFSLFFLFFYFLRGSLFSFFFFLSYCMIMHAIWYFKYWLDTILYMLMTIQWVTWFYILFFCVGFVLSSLQKWLSVVDLFLVQIYILEFWLYFVGTCVEYFYYQYPLYILTLYSD